MFSIIPIELFTIHGNYHMKTNRITKNTATELLNEAKYPKTTYISIIQFCSKDIEASKTLFFPGKCL